MNLQFVNIPVWDYGFTMGVAVSEQLRTFRGRLHQLDHHLERLQRGLEITGIDPGMSLEELGNIATEVAWKNYEMVPSHHDVGLTIVVTPGAQPGRVPAALEPAQTGEATVLMSGAPLPFHTWVDQYEYGVRLVTVHTRDIPHACVPHELKCRSRMHYYLAEREADQIQPGARALLRDVKGYVAEGTIASVVMVKGDTIYAPREQSILPGVSMRYLQESICPAIGMKFKRRHLSATALKESDELLWLSTSPCVLPISELDGHQISTPESRPIFWKIVHKWSEQVGLHIVEQARNA